MNTTYAVEMIIVAALAIRALIYFASALSKIIDEMGEQSAQGELPSEKPRLP